MFECYSNTRVVARLRARKALAWLGLLPLGTGCWQAHAQTPTITALSPARHATAVLPAAAVSLTFSQPIAAATAGAIKVVSGQYGGVRAVSQQVSGNVVTLRMEPVGAGSAAFRPGETVRVSVPATVQATTGQAVAPTVYQFTIAAGGTGRGSFVVGTPVLFSSSPGEVALADLDADGDLDMLTPLAGLGGNLVALRLNDGRGVFAGGTDVTVRRSPSGVAVADVDGDGDLDLLAACTADNTVSVRLNNGQGSFVGGTDVPGFTSPYRVTTADIDADGDLDMLAYQNDQIRVVFNNGRGAFGNGVDVPMGNGPLQITTGDVDGDGDLDLLNTSFTAGIVHLRLNQGNGTFGPDASLAVGAYTPDATLADMDGDGDLDLLVTNARSNTLALWSNNGSGSFTAGVPVAMGNYPQYQKVADVDADGDLDVIAGNLYGNSASVRFNDGRGNLAGGADYPLGANTGNLATGDVDGDGDVDFVTAVFATTSTAGLVQVLLNQGALCPLQDSTTVPIAPAGVTGLCGQNQVELRLIAGLAADVRYEWQYAPVGGFWQVLPTGNGQPSYQATRAGRYRVRVVRGGCEVTSAATEVRAAGDVIGSPPSIFTPNGDGINDVFELKLPQPLTFELQIFNRWGREIFRTTRPGDYWTGAGVPTGVYYYRWRYSTACEPTGRTTVGTVTVTR